MDDLFSFDPKKYLTVLWRMLPVLIISLIAGAAGGMGYSRILADHLYSATSKFYVISGDWATEARADDYIQIIKSQSVVRSVIVRENVRAEDGSYLSYEAYLGRLEVSAYDETHIAGITFFDSDPYRACDVTNTHMEAAVDAIQEIMNPGTIKVVQEATVPVNTAKPNEMLFCITGAAAFFAAALLVVFAETIIEKFKADKRKLRKRLYVGIPALLGAFFIAAIALHESNADHTGPVILFPGGNIVYTQGEDYDSTDLLQAVRAEDEVDGDCTEFIRIDGVYVSESGQSCTIDYVVKDRSNNVTIAERYASYRKEAENEDVNDAGEIEAGEIEAGEN